MLRLKELLLQGQGRAGRGERVVAQLGCQVVPSMFHILGCCWVAARLLDCHMWDHVVNFFHAKFSLLKAMFLSMGGWLVLHKFILSFILKYAMLVYVLPINTRKVLHELMRRFSGEL